MIYQGMGFEGPNTQEALLTVAQPWYPAQRLFTSREDRKKAREQRKLAQAKAASLFEVRQIEAQQNRERQRLMQAASRARDSISRAMEELRRKQAIAQAQLERSSGAFASAQAQAAAAQDYAQRVTDALSAAQAQANIAAPAEGDFEGLAAYASAMSDAAARVTELALSVSPAQSGMGWAEPGASVAPWLLGAGLLWALFR